MLFCAVERIDRFLFEAEDQHGPGGNAAAAVDRTTVGCITLALARNPLGFYLPFPAPTRHMAALWTVPGNLAEVLRDVFCV